MDLSILLSQSGNVSSSALAFIVTLAIVIFIHEFGHYIVGRWCGIKADVFSLGFGPVLLSRRDKHGTRWQIAAIPLGGYVKFRGDENAASLSPGASSARPSAKALRESLQGAPLWARALTIFAGPLFNFLSAIAILTGLFMAFGVGGAAPVISERAPLPASHPLYQGAERFLLGDRILALEGTPTPDTAAFYRRANALSAQERVRYTLSREGAQITLEAPAPFVPIAGFIVPQSAAYDAGLRRGDVILALDGAPVSRFAQRSARVRAAPQGTPLTLLLWREGEVFERSLTPRITDVPRAEGGFEKRPMLGINSGSWLSFEPRYPALPEALRSAVEGSGLILKDTLLSVSHMISGAISSCSLSGPIGIAEFSKAAASTGLEDYLFFVALLSLSVGVMNLFPIPILDGGHLVLIAYEAIVGRPLPPKVLLVLMYLGGALLAGLMLFALTNDLFCP